MSSKQKYREQPFIGQRNVFWNINQVWNLVCLSICLSVCLSAGLSPITHHKCHPIRRLWDWGTFFGTPHTNCADIFVYNTKKKEITETFCCDLSRAKARAREKDMTQKKNYSLLSNWADKKSMSLSALAEKPGFFKGKTTGFLANANTSCLLSFAKIRKFL